MRCGNRCIYFNPRAPYGARLKTFTSMVYDLVFQSTRPIRGATLVFRRFFPWMKHFNPRAPYGARRGRIVQTTFLCVDFNPRAPYGARPGAVLGRVRRRRISIHAPHTGRDQQRQEKYPRPKDFNPRAPYGARLSRRNKQRISSRFQSTRPIRGATRPITI